MATRQASTSSDAALIISRESSNSSVFSGSSGERQRQQLYAAADSDQAETSFSNVPTGATGETATGAGPGAGMKLMRKQTSKILFDKSKLPSQVSEEDEAFRPTREQESCGEAYPETGPQSVKKPLATSGKVLFDSSIVAAESAKKKQKESTEENTRKSSASDRRVLFAADGAKDVPEPISRSISSGKLRLSTASDSDTILTELGVGGETSSRKVSRDDDSLHSSGNKIEDSNTTESSGGASVVPAERRMKKQMSKTLFARVPDNNAASVSDRRQDSSIIGSGSSPQYVRHDAPIYV